MRSLRSGIANDLIGDAAEQNIHLVRQTGPPIATHRPLRQLAEQGRMEDVGGESGSNAAGVDPVIGLRSRPRATRVDPMAALRCE